MPMAKCNKHEVDGMASWLSIQHGSGKILKENLSVDGFGRLVWQASALDR
jgi:hypothetical protein